ncbi:MAG: sigma-54 dependent transcriptional regulator [Planctomycetota bacterium]|nr:sigma-54 dependent transcriptional regulator [Planctomycetota bacterium]
MNTVVITYNELDGACAAATVLCAHPNAQIRISSAFRIAQSLEELLQSDREPIEEVHICGVGIYCELQPVVSVLKELKKRGARCVWYCGRGYLNSIKSKLGRACETAFLDSAGTNTAAVCRHLKLQKNSRARLLQKIVRENRRTSDRDIENLRDLAYAKMARYFKLYDLEAYPAAIRKLAGLSEVTPADLAEVEHYRSVQFKHALQGRSKAVKQLRRRIAAVARHGFATALILGPSGVGKERVARLLYEESPRHGKPFVAVNCANFNADSDLADSALFGHRKGAFTGATHDHPGIFEQADGGTLFLDEIGELPLPVQGKLLRALQEGTIDPVGQAGASIKVDVRIIAATNRDPRRQIREGKFREDLFYRLNIIRLDVPPLNERKEDIPIVATSVMETLKSKYKNEVSPLNEKQFRDLQSYDWPGNVRQLQAILERSVVFQESNLASLIHEEAEFYSSRPEMDGTEIEMNPFDAFIRHTETGILLPEEVDESLAPEQLLSLRELERIYVRRAIRICGGNKTRTAKALGITLNTLKAKERG